MAKKANEPSKSGDKQTLSDALVQAQVALQKGGGELRATADIAEFSKRLIYTRSIELDLITKIGFQGRVQLLGEPSMGKTLLGLRLMAASQQTCRICYTPILQFINDRTGEAVTTCRCGVCDNMVGVLFDLELDFDHAWAQTWGVQLGSTNPADYKEIFPGVKMAPNSKFMVVRLQSLDQLTTVAQHLISNGAADFLMVDSLTSLSSRESIDGKSQPGTKARAVNQLMSAINSGAAACWIKHRSCPTVVFINQYRNKIGGSPMADPRTASGGYAPAYMSFQNLHITASYSDESGGFKGEKAWGDVTVKSKKDKFGGSVGAEASYRVYLKPVDVNRVRYNPGDTNEGAQLWSLISELGSTGDKRWCYKDSKGYHVLGRTFKTAKDIQAFLSRPDIGYLLRLPIYALRFPRAMRKHLNREQFDYTPFRDDPILELIDEATERIGKAVLEDVPRADSGAGEPSTSSRKADEITAEDLGISEAIEDESVDESLAGTDE